ncbi:MAG TPA: 50S ribosomal protein L6 [Thermoanaerobaculia bacterium]|nr:50S ribosomal protein L6 [Thermoanaerobaculia bacterium]
MSRIGRLPIQLPEGAQVSLDGRVFTASGPKGNVAQDLVDGIDVKIEDGTVTVLRSGDSGPDRAKHGLMRALLANAVKGVTEGWSRELEIHGVGFRAEAKANEVHLALGYSHPVVFRVPEGVKVEVDRNTRIVVSGADRQQVGQVAAEIRKLRRPDAYKGKGIRYKDERLKLKVGKAGVG